MPVLTQSEIKSFVELLPIVAALFRIRNAQKVYLTFLAFILVGGLFDMIAATTNRLYHSNVVVSNIYCFVEYLVLLTFFYCIDGKKYFKLFLSLAIAGTVIWAADNLVLHSFFTINSSYRIFYSFVIVVLSIRQINITVETDEAVVGNALLLACFCFIVYFSCRALIESFYLFRFKLRDIFYTNLFHIMSWVNLFINLLYTLVIIWIPKKKAYCMQ